MSEKERAKGQSDMAARVIKECILSKYSITEEDTEKDFGYFLNQILPEDMSGIMSSILKGGSLSEIKRLIVSIANKNRKIIKLEEENVTLKNNLQLSEESQGFQTKRKPELDHLLKIIQASDFKYGRILYHIIVTRKVENCEVQYWEDGRDHGFDIFKEFLENNNIISKEDSEGNRKVLITPTFDLNQISNKILLYSELTRMYIKSTLGNSIEAHGIKQSHFATEYEKLYEEGWFAFNGKYYVKGYHESWKYFSLEYLVNHAKTNK
ncbi:hypothetical protein U8V72_21120 [Priestia filamentosa]|uniref:hypothetical protein n=1 Tax=Priestia filamentosa TaxID=1402861 RepID=UPI00397C0328